MRARWPSQTNLKTRVKVLCGCYMLRPGSSLKVSQADLMAGFGGYTVSGMIAPLADLLKHLIGSAWGQFRAMTDEESGDVTISRHRVERMETAWR